MKKKFYGILTEVIGRDTFVKISDATNREDAVREADLCWWKYTTASERKNRVITVREVEVDITPDKDIMGAVIDALTESEDYFHIFDQDSIEGPVYFESLTSGQENGILIWKNPIGGRWEITVTNWDHMQYDTEIQYGDEIFRFDAPHKVFFFEDLSDYLTNDNGELWATVKDDEEDDIPRLMEAHMPGIAYDYGNLTIVVPAEWN